MLSKQSVDIPRFKSRVVSQHRENESSPLQRKQIIRQPHQLDSSSNDSLVSVKLTTSTKDKNSGLNSRAQNKSQSPNERVKKEQNYYINKEDPYFTNLDKQNRSPIRSSRLIITQSETEINLDKRLIPPKNRDVPSLERRQAIKQMELPIFKDESKIEINDITDSNDNNGEEQAQNDNLLLFLTTPMYKEYMGKQKLPQRQTQKFDINKLKILHSNDSISMIPNQKSEKNIRQNHSTKILDQYKNITLNLNERSTLQQRPQTQIKNRARLQYEQQYFQQQEQYLNFSEENIKSRAKFHDDFNLKLDLIDQIESRNFRVFSSSHNDTSLTDKDNYINSSHHNLNNSTTKSQKQMDNIIDNLTIESALLNPTKVNILKCQLNDFLYFKVKVFEQRSPLKLKLSYIQTPTSYVKVLMSASCLQPNNFNYDQIFYNSKVIAINDEFKGYSTIFKKQNYLYFSITSDLSLDVSIKVSFGQKFKQIRSDYYYYYQGYDQGADALSKTENEQKKDDKEKTIKNDLILKNIVALKEIDQFTRCLSVHSQKRNKQEHLKTVSQKAAIIATNKIHHLIKMQEDKTVKKIIKINTFRLSFFIYFWQQLVNYYTLLISYSLITCIYKIGLVKITNLIYNKYLEKKESIRIFSKIAWQSLPLTNKFKNFKGKYPKDLIHNNLRYARVGIQLFTSLVKKLIKKEAGKLLFMTLKSNSEGAEFHNKMKKYYQNVISVQKNYKTFRIKKINYKKLLMNLWDKYYLMGMEQTIEIKKSGENDQLFWRKKQNVLNLINQIDIKVEAIDLFFHTLFSDFRNKINAYFKQLEKIPKEQKLKIRLLQSLLLIDEEEAFQKQQQQIFENYNEDMANQLDISLDNLNISSSKQINKEYLNKPRLFIMPTFKEIKELLRIGVNLYVSKNPDFIQKITIKKNV